MTVTIHMARRVRIEEIGFYHIINRGVEHRTVFLSDDDRDKFIDIIDETADLYKFIMHSFCLMDNHYHLLIEITKTNLSLIMRQINSKYAIYFNKKYNRVGHLWQGRFQSWYIYDESYLFSLVKYIECNPIKAGITRKIGDFAYASSFFLTKPIAPKIKMHCLNLGIIIRLDNTTGLLGLSENIVNENDKNQLSELHQAKFNKKSNGIARVKCKHLSDYSLFDCNEKL